MQLRIAEKPYAPEFYHVICLALVMLAAYAPSLMAQAVPTLINYQGQISKSDGSPVPTADYVLTLKVFDSALGGEVVWGPQIYDGSSGAGHSLKVPVVQGYFNVMLGPVDVAGRPIENAFLGADRYVEVTVGDAPPISPRQRILSAPFAINSLLAINSLRLAGQDWAAVFGVNDPVNGQIPKSKIAPGAIDSSRLSEDVNLHYRIPAGSIMPYSGTNAPPGWSFCWGASLEKQKFPELYSVIGNAWGTNSNPELFMLPDLRGLFLRALDNGNMSNPAGVDPDRMTRFPVNAGGNSGIAVGSLQGDQVGPHVHQSRYVAVPASRDGIPVGSGQIAHISFIQATGGPDVSGLATTESRPKNAYVNYIIKH